MIILKKQTYGKTDKLMSILCIYICFTFVILRSKELNKAEIRFIVVILNYENGDSFATFFLICTFRFCPQTFSIHNHLNIHNTIIEIGWLILGHQSFFHCLLNQHSYIIYTHDVCQQFLQETLSLNEKFFDYCR